MRSKFCGAVSVCIFALLLPAVTSAQISFIPGLARQVPSGPAYIAADDFNGDGILDAAVASTISDRVTVLFGSPDANFSGAVVDIPVGRLLRDLTTNDFNGDGIRDIAVADFFLAKVFIISGKGTNGVGDGSFSAPAGFAAAVRGPIDVTTGNFDNRLGPDLAAANGVQDTFTVFANEGGNHGLRSLGNFPGGNTTHAIMSSDFNGDHIDDLLLLDTGARFVDEVSLFLNSGTGTFQSVIPQRFIVGVGAKAMTLGDFNGDHKVDIAVLNTGGAGANNFTISILLADQSPNFRVLPPATFSCPSRLNGTSISCTPQDIKAADFDSDTRTDLALSFSTRATDTEQTTAGFVQALSGRGDGTFDFGAQVIVGLGPRRMVAADVTGDAVPDIVVTAFTNNTVQVLRSKTPPQRDPGEPCVVGKQCVSNSCVDGVCCNTATCPEGQRCDVISSPGICAPPAPNGDPCTIGAQCNSHFCVDGFCCGSRSCNPGLFCNSGVCAPPAGNGVPCNDDLQCASGFCTDGFCCSDDRCAVNAACNLPGTEGICTTRLPISSPCTDPRQCCTDDTDPLNCDPSFCEDGFCCEKKCPAGQSCGLPGQEGFCAVLPPASLTPTRTATPTRTPTPAPNGAPCSTGSNCTSGNCVDNACCDVPSCPATQSCSMPGGAGSCKDKGGPGVVCDGNEDCQSGLICKPGTPSVCATAPPTLTPTPTHTATPVPPGGPCASTAQCQAGFLCNTVEGGICCNQQVCETGSSCRLSTNPGACQPLPTPTRTPTPLREIGAVCTNDNQCDTFNCVDGRCCTATAAECARPNRCDVFNFEGNCIAPGPAGSDCNKNSDCEEGLLCNGNPPQCNPPFTPTPTIFIRPEATPTLIIITDVSRSGGCAVDQTAGGNDPRNVLVLAGLPFAFWLRRRAVVRLVRNRRQ